MVKKSNNHPNQSNILGLITKLSTKQFVFRMKLRAVGCSYFFLQRVSRFCRLQAILWHFHHHWAIKLNESDDAYPLLPMKVTSSISWTELVEYQLSDTMHDVIIVTPVTVETTWWLPMDSTRKITITKLSLFSESHMMCGYHVYHKANKLDVIQLHLMYLSVGLINVFLGWTFLLRLRKQPASNVYIV